MNKFHVSHEKGDLKWDLKSNQRISSSQVFKHKLITIDSAHIFMISFISAFDLMVFNFVIKKIIPKKTNSKSMTALLTFLFDWVFSILTPILKKPFGQSNH